MIGILDSTGRGMDGQGLRRGGYSDDPSCTNQQSSYDTPQSGQSNYGDLSGSTLSQQRLNPTTTSSQPNVPALQAYGGYYSGNSSVAGANALNQGAYQQNNYAIAGPSRQYAQSYYAPYTSAPPYQALQPMLNNPLAYDPERQPAQLQMLQQDDFDDYDLDQGQPSIQQQLQNHPHLPPAPNLPLYQPGRCQAALLQPPLPSPQQQPATMAAPALPQQSPFEVERAQVNANLGDIIPIINNHGNLNQAKRMLWDTTERFIEAVEEMQLTLDIPDQDQRGFQLWHDFNRTWLALFQAQYNRTYDLLQSGQLLDQPGLMTQQTIYDTITDLSQLARDNVEEKGLLDYEWGLWEADITRAANRCMLLFSGCLKAANQGGYPPNSKMDLDARAGPAP